MKKINNKFNNKFKENLILGSLLIIIYLFLLNSRYFLKGFDNILNMLNPFIIGFAIAFVLNLPMNFFENKVFSFFNNKNFSKYTVLKRPLSILSTFIFVIGLIIALLLFIIPQLVSSISNLLETVPGHLKTFEKSINEYLLTNQMSTEVLNKVYSSLMSTWKEILQIGGQLLTNSLSGILNTTLNITSGVINFILSLVFSIYMLASKETLIRHMKKFIYAFLKKPIADKVLRISRLTNLTFSKFITGQCIEAIILGALCFIGMNIFSFPYPLLVSVLVGVTALIPVFGAFIGTIPSVFLILLISPIKAIWFIVFILCLQQFEGNIIYPKVVGNSVGLSAIWVILAMLVGGSTLGLLGMIIGIPVFSVIYQLVKEKTNKKLLNKNITIK
ncbi:AI-2E family transporter [Clostridium sp.]|uniref:AI-2E family transporter n=1 Tax=Clostridium sp. TaxID=1506 RepID=UPI00260A7CA5|nr:AI-2E family transporter [Clostridium sp.]